MKKLPSLALPALLALLTGCYHYVPEAGRVMKQGTPVRIELRRPESFELSSLTAHNIRSVTGEMVREVGGEVSVSALWLDAATGEGFAGENWTFRIPRDNIATLRIRTLSRWRTAAVAIAGFVATSLGWEALKGSDAGGGEGDPGGVAR